MARHLTPAEYAAQVEQAARQERAQQMAREIIDLPGIAVLLEWRQVALDAVAAYLLEKGVA